MSNIASHWWMFVARGLASLTLAVLLLLGPGWSSSEAVALAFGVYALIDGGACLGFVAGATGVRRTAYVVRGLLGIGAGVMALTDPSAPTLALYLLIGVWGTVGGALEIAFGSHAWGVVPKALGFMLAGAVSFGFGLTVLDFPLEGVVTLRAFLAAYALMNGVAATAFGEVLHHTPGATRLRPAT
jgi:uncharacterized membrane protein HdeD (DUF308 family)